MKTDTIEQVTGDGAIDLALDTLTCGKQALVFVNSKRSAEATAEKVAKKQTPKADLKPIADDILSALSSPTKQCKRLAYCVHRGTAFHHSGLAGKQRRIVEEAFIAGNIKMIGATPTLAAGINIPAFRCIIRDLQRFTGAGMADIPVLEYHQMAGRAGRPDFNEEYGEAIVVAKNEKQAERYEKQYLFGHPEPIYSKVAALPVLRTYCLSLVATGFVSTRKELVEFFAETFFAHQYGDLKGITAKIDETLGMLVDWGFLEGEKTEDEFVTAADMRGPDDLQATRLGLRVSELYLDPLTAHQLITGLMRLERAPFFGYVHLVCSSQEMRPLLRIKVADYEELEDVLKDEELLRKEPSIYDPDYETFLAAVKTAKLLADWCEEKSEEDLLEAYGVRPGELRYRTDIADWLLYAASELARILKRHQHIAPMAKARTRLKYGVKEELLALLKFKNIGRVRSRTLHRNGIRSAGDVKKADANTLSELLGPNIAKDLKKQVGQDIEDEQLNPRKRKGQLSLQAKRFQR